MTLVSAFLGRQHRNLRVLRCQVGVLIAVALFSEYLGFEVILVLSAEPHLALEACFEGTIIREVVVLIFVFGKRWWWRDVSCGLFERFSWGWSRGGIEDALPVYDLNAPQSSSWSGALR